MDGLGSGSADLKVDVLLEVPELDAGKPVPESNAKQMATPYSSSTTDRTECAKLFPFLDFLTHRWRSKFPKT